MSPIALSEVKYITQIKFCNTNMTFNNSFVSYEQAFLLFFILFVICLNIKNKVHLKGKCMLNVLS